MALEHPFEPVVNARSQILILGSFPSVRSRLDGFYYGHPRNRFWTMLSHVLGQPMPITVDEKKALLLEHGVALWDSAKQCEIVGSADAKMSDVVPNDMKEIFEKARIRAIFFNGKEAEKIFMQKKSTVMCPMYVLPSTSPANAAWDTARLTKVWAEAFKPYLGDR